MPLAYKNGQGKYVADFALRTVRGKPIVNFILKTDRATIRGKDKSVADFAKITLLLTFP